MYLTSEQSRYRYVSARLAIPLLRAIVPEELSKALQ